MIIKINVNKHYGNEFYYPDCQFSRMLCELLRQKSLTTRDIEILKENNYTIEAQYIMKLKTKG